jgi:Zn-dependent alcohol dehydrogenase
MHSHTHSVHFLAEETFVATGTDVAGEVVEVGPGVTNFKTGDKVVTILTHCLVSAHLIFWCFSFPYLCSFSNDLHW